MTLKEYASSIYSQMKSASTGEKVEEIYNGAINNLKRQDFSDTQIEDFKDYLLQEASQIREAQENEQTLKNQQIALALLKKEN